MTEYHYKELLKESLEGGQLRNDTEIRKRRKIREQNTSNNLNEANSTKIDNQEVISISDGDPESDDSAKSSDFEDVSLDNENESYRFDLLQDDAKISDGKHDSLSIAIHPVHEKEVKKTRKFTPISKEERNLRRIIHRMYVVLMLCHGAIRNRWCNDYNLLMKLREHVSPQILELLLQKESKDVLPLVKSRRFLDGLKKLMMMYSSNYRPTSQGLVRKNWNELSIKQTKVEEKVNFDKFANLVTHFRGSRDIAAQGFVSLLRSIGLNGRLVFSLQPPDFTSIAELPKIDLNNQNRSTAETADAKFNPLIQKFGLGNNKHKLLASIREKPTTIADEVKNVNYFEDSPYPIFWVEVWDKYVKKWVSIDPIVLQTIEVPPMRRKCKFEPPSTDIRNQLTYVIAYDRLGGVKDVTRRYSQFYNAKTVKKNIQFRSDEDENWYNRIIKASCLTIRKHKINKIDILESKEFHTRDLAEGVPNNIADFKNHPVYALESQLKQNEIIFPKDDTSTCGFFRNKLSKKAQKKEQAVIPIYKRSHVYTLKSAKAWYLRGRVLKLGVQPLKLKKKKIMLKLSTSDEDDEEETTRLYAEFQTKLYNPLPIIGGVIPKNAYGNIDIYTPSMLPEDGYLIETTLQYSMRIIERAAKIIEIDYAKAIVAFDFGKPGKRKSHNRNPTAREGGILIDVQYKEAACLVINALVEEEESLRKRAVEMNSLNNWKYFLTKLRISERLNKEHGELKNEEDESLFSNELEDDNFSVHSDNPGSDINKVESGGFFIESNSASDVQAVRNMETDVSALRELDHGEEIDTYAPSLDKKLRTNEDHISEQDSFIGQGGGGFFVEDRVEEVMFHRPMISKESNDDELEDMPDEYFKKDVNGEMVYDPTNGVQETTEANFLINDSHHKSESEDVVFALRSPENVIPEEMDARGDVKSSTHPILDENDGCEGSLLKSISEIRKRSQESLGEEIAEEEQAFGFEYSDSD